MFNFLTGLGLTTLGAWLLITKLLPSQNPQPVVEQSSTNKTTGSSTEVSFNKTETHVYLHILSENNNMGNDLIKYTPNPVLSTESTMINPLLEILKQGLPVKIIPNKEENPSVAPVLTTPTTTSSSSIGTTATNFEICSSKECAYYSNRMFRHMNTSVNPCMDLTEFTCGRYPYIDDSLSIPSPKHDDDNKFYRTIRTLIDKYTIGPTDDNWLFNKIKSSYTECRKSTTVISVIIGEEKAEKEGISCIKDITDNKMTLAVELFYLKQKKLENLNKQVEKIIKDLLKALKTALSSSACTDQKSISKYLTLLETLTPNVGYPDELLDMEKLTRYYKDHRPVDSLALFSTVPSDLQIYYKLEDIGSKYYPFYATGGISYNLTINWLPISTAHLQEPYYFPNSPDYINYATMGHLIIPIILQDFMTDYYSNNREKFNFFLYCPSENDPSFENDTEAYSRTAIERSFLSISYMAYKDSRKDEEPRLSNDLKSYSPDQMFWISYIGSYDPWCLELKMRPEYQEFYQNTIEFRKSFDCPAL